jgi:uncharacterized membrane protein (UPF0136 family)
MKAQGIATSIYGILLLIGGIIGYATAHSLPSLIMGTAFAILMGVFAWGMFKGCNVSRLSVLGLSALLLAFFGYRFIASYKLFPPGVMAILSLALLLYLMPWKKPCCQCVKK